MPAKILEFPRVRGIRHAQTGLVFPQIHRISGFFWENEDERKVSGNPVPPRYTLSEYDTPDLANPTIEPIARLTPGKDPEVMVLKRHLTREHAAGYIDALIDVLPDTVYERSLYYKDHSIFTLVYFSGTRFKRYPLHCIQILDEIVTPAEIPNVRAHIIHPDGSVTTDDFIFFPSEDKDEDASAA